MAAPPRAPARAQRPASTPEAAAFLRLRLAVAGGRFGAAFGALRFGCRRLRRRRRFCLASTVASTVALPSHGGRRWRHDRHGHRGVSAASSRRPAGVEPEVSPRRVSCARRAQLGLRHGPWFYGPPAHRRPAWPRPPVARLSHRRWCSLVTGVHVCSFVFNFREHSKFVNIDQGK